jgi:hypothetical protein
MTVRRLKTYTAQSGYVYHYYFVGRRPALPTDLEAPASEYVFDISVDQGARCAVSVFLKPDALDAWRAAYDRALTEAEQYAAAKLRLLQMLDELPAPAHSSQRVNVTSENILELLASIGLDS